MTTITLPDGRVFPEHEGEALSWSIGLYMTTSEAFAGHPKARAVVRAMLAHRPEQLERERRELVRDSLGRLFGHNAAAALRVIESERCK